MNKEEILNNYIDLIDKGYCCDCNELNCIDNFPQAKIAHAIKELQQENKQLKKRIDKAIELEEEIMYLANKTTITTQNIEVRAVRDRLEYIFKILKGEE